MKVSLLTLFLAVALAASITAAWNKAGGESVALSFLLGSMAYLVSTPIIGILYWYGCSFEVVFNTVFWAIALVVVSALVCFAVDERPRSMVVWTNSGFVLSAVCASTGWIAGVFLDYPLKRAFNQTGKNAGGN